MARIRTGNISDADYVADFPNAETDVDRAKAMAVRSKASEQTVVHLGNLTSFAAEGDLRGALDYQSSNRNELPFSVRDRTVVAPTSQYLDETKEARAQADTEAEHAGADFDRVKSVLDEVADLKSGRSTQTTGSARPHLSEVA